LEPPILTVDYTASVERSTPVGPVGGFVEPANKLAVATPYLALFGPVATIAIVATAPWNRPDN